MSIQCWGLLRKSVQSHLIQLQYLQQLPFPLCILAGYVHQFVLARNGSHAFRMVLWLSLLVSFLVVWVLTTSTVAAWLRPSPHSDITKFSFEVVVCLSLPIATFLWPNQTSSLSTVLP